MTERIKKILLETIYTPDAKPRFVGGDLDTKLSYIDEAVVKIESLYKQTPETIASEILSGYDDDDSLTLVEMMDAIKEHAKVDDSTMIDWVDGVGVWEMLENRYSCKDFLEAIDFEYEKYNEWQVIVHDAIKTISGEVTPDPNNGHAHMIRFGDWTVRVYTDRAYWEIEHTETFEVSRGVYNHYFYVLDNENIV